MYSRFRHFIYGCLILPDDIFEAIVRKAVITIGLVSVPFAFVFVPATLKMHQDGLYSTSMTAVATISSLARMLTSLGCYLYVRKTRHVPDFLITIFLLAWVATLLVIALNVSSGSNHLYALLAVSVSITCGHFPSHGIAYLFILIDIFNSYNSVCHQTDACTTFFIGSGELSTASVAALEILTLVSAFWILFNVHVCRKEYLNQLRRYDLALLTASIVAEQLVDYDTERARDVLSQYSTLEDSDKSLFSALGTIIGNMESYRPFLPNYLHSPLVVETAAGSAAATSDGGFDEAINNVAVGAHSAVDNPSTHSSLTSGGNGTPVAVPDMSITNFDADTPSLAVLPQCCETLMTDVPLQRQTVTSPPPVLFRQCEERRVTLVILNTPVFYRGGADSAVITDNLASEATTLVDTLHDLADSTGGVVHAFYANNVYLSWNSVRRVVQHEVHAARFLARVHRQLGRGGVACSGPSVSYLCGQRHVTPFMQCAWFPEISYLYRSYVLKLKTTICHENVANAVRNIVFQRVIGAYRQVEKASPLFSSSWMSLSTPLETLNEPPYIRVYEILDERESVDGEIITTPVTPITLQRRRSHLSKVDAECRVVSEAVEHSLRGEHELALTWLQALPGHPLYPAEGDRVIGDVLHRIRLAACDKAPFCAVWEFENTI
eukprot:PhM_4_TR7097/c0_g1_i1/m.1844